MAPNSSQKPEHIGTHPANSRPLLPVSLQHGRWPSGDNRMNNSHDGSHIYATSDEFGSIDSSQRKCWALLALFLVKSSVTMGVISHANIIQCAAVNTWSIFSKYTHNRHPIARPVRARYEMSFVSIRYDLCSNLNHCSAIFKYHVEQDSVLSAL